MSQMSEEVRQAYERLTVNERRLGVVIPPIMMDLLSIEDLFGYFVAVDEEIPFRDRYRLWTNAVVDGFLDFVEWEPADQNNWFERFVSNPDLEKLIIIATHAESFLCLDYRECGPSATPKVVYTDTTDERLSFTTICESAEEFARVMIESAAACERD
jgi:hypothetical protein